MKHGGNIEIHEHSANAKRGGLSSREYGSWSSMRSRCSNINDPRYSSYGGRGITVCERWSDFRNFLSDMGKRPIGHSLDRKDNNGNYEPNNCKWSTTKEQLRNTRNCVMLDFNGKRQCISAWAEEMGIKSITLQKRLKWGWSIERALTEPVGHTVSGRYIRTPETIEKAKRTKAINKARREPSP